jgi:glutamine amidotransferase
MSVVIISYNAGNTSSVKFALARLGVDAVVSSDAAVIGSADKVILPGVGAAGAAMQYLRNSRLDDVICSLTQPVLGICLGMQLLCRYSEEDNTECLGLVDADVRRLRGDGKVPHTGWNSIDGFKSELFRGVDAGSYVYFVHSYAVPVCSAGICGTEYLQTFSSGIQQDNFYGLQFHPEKSGVAGETILKNFLEL